MTYALSYCDVDSLVRIPQAGAFGDGDRHTHSLFNRLWCCCNKHIDCKCHDVHRANESDSEAHGSIRLRYTVETRKSAGVQLDASPVK